MNKLVDIKDLIPIMQEQLDNGKSVSFVPRGDSMLPMLHNGTDLIILEKPQGRLHLFDVALYYRRETDRYVVHRVVGTQKDGSYIMLGDHNFRKEYDIRHEDVIGVVKAFYRKGKMRDVNHPLYKLYCDFWFYTRPIRLAWNMAKSAGSRG